VPPRGVALVVAYVVPSIPVANATGIEGTTYAN